MLLLGWTGKPVSARVKSSPRPVPVDSSTPYLRAIGSLALRFHPMPAAPEPAARPAASGPPLPSATPAARQDISPATPTASPANPLSPAAEPAATTPATAKNSPPIIPDEMRPRVQPEDFLPFFQFPVSGDGQVILPIKAAPNPSGIPSTATYRQQ